MLRVVDLHKYYGNDRILAGVDLHVRKGEIKGLIGVNGAGKTTLIECVCGVKPLTSGKVYIKDQDISKTSARNAVKPLIGYMPQAFGMFNDLTTEENLSYLCAVYGIEKPRLEDVIKECFLEKERKVLACNLSGGYRKLLSMACALIHRPELLILDEPTVAMDPIFRERFREIVKKEKEKGRTILFITHYFEELRDCDTFACLSDGRIVYEGAVSDVLEKSSAEQEAFWQNFFLGEKK